MKIERAWAMPSRWTFSIPPIAAWIAKRLENASVIVDPFCGESILATHRNDSSTGIEAVEWLTNLKVHGDVVLFDPPYPPRQITECYAANGKKATMLDTSARFYASAKDAIAQRCKVGGKALSFGWNSGGLGMKRGFKIRSILMVAHGDAHNDTICVEEERVK